LLLLKDVIMKMSSKGDWRAPYAAKLAEGRDAVRAVRRGQKVFIGSGAALPRSSKARTRPGS